MKTLTIASVVSVLCTVLVGLYSVPQLVLNGVIEISSGFELMVVFPTLVGLPASLVGAIAGIVAFTRRVDLGWAGILMAVGQVITWVLVIAIIVWATAFASTGWELIALPFALMLGQIVVAAGLIMAIVDRRKHTARRAAHAST